MSVVRWEYRVVSLRDGRYTESLNEYGRDGWELVSVVPDPADRAPKPAPRKLPMPGALGKLGDVASKLNELDREEPASPLLWVLRRPLPGDEGSSGA